MKSFSSNDKIQPTIMTDETKNRVIDTLTKLAGECDIKVDPKNGIATIYENKNSRYVFACLAVSLMKAISGDYYIVEDEDIDYDNLKSICYSILMPKAASFSRTVADTTEFSYDDCYKGVVITEDRLSYCEYITLEDAVKCWLRNNCVFQLPLNVSFNESVDTMLTGIDVKKMEKAFAKMLQFDPRYWHTKDEAREYAINKMITSREKCDIPICNYCHSLLAFDFGAFVIDTTNPEKVPIYCPNCDEIHYANLKIHGETNPTICDICIYEKPATPIK